MSIQNFLQQTAVIYPKSGRNKFGRDASGSGTSTKCRFQNKTKLIVLANQQPVQLVGIFYFDGAVTINTEDRITYNGVSYKVFSINGNIDGHGIQRMIKVEVEKWQT